MDKEIYNSIFQEEIHDLIALKRALGFSYRAEAGSLRRIDTFLCENNLSEKRISKELCDLWCRKRTYETVTNQASRISVMRVFCRYLNDIGIPAKGADTMHIFTQMKNFKVFLMQLTKVSRCRIPARIVLM